jgi:hypothetical protein
VSTRSVVRRRRDEMGHCASQVRAHYEAQADRVASRSAVLLSPMSALQHITDSSQPLRRVRRVPRADSCKRRKQHLHSITVDDRKYSCRDGEAERLPQF